MMWREDLFKELNIDKQKIKTSVIITDDSNKDKEIF